ncbi:MAG: 2,3-bisphosphoglycerate-independent phosphoglycerate mutase [Chitinophagales bacterium]|nr:2,3-bisphosphoglycerate-independent phosphoglycerate mutase [Chitinophagales bacterium]
METNKKVILIIMDGWGHGQEPSKSAISQANTEFVDSLYMKYPHSELTTHSESVGLPDGQMGNSEVGHLNIGAGRIVYQELLRINRAIANDELQMNPELIDSFEYAKRHDKNLHFIGLLSDGGVHSHIDHLKALCTYAEKYGLKKVFIHAFTDGRDTDPKSGKDFIVEIQNHISDLHSELVSVVGRYYAMDRDKRWERIKLAYDLLVSGKGKQSEHLSQAIEASYSEGVTDEFVKPVLLKENGKISQRIENGDAVVCFNFRTDRCRQITEALTQKDFPNHDMKTIDLHYTTMTNYDHSFKNINVIFEKENIQNTLGEYLSANNLKQIRIAETEKYPHVTFFFSGGRETEFPGEKRIMVPSPKVATYDLQPEMSAIEVSEKIMKELDSKSADFVCLNFANPDMVAHTGVFEAAVKAVETIDNCVEKVVGCALKNDYTVVLTSDHGNADYMINDDGSPNTAHTKNPVPLFIIDNNKKFEVKDGKLADIAPTILKIMNLDVPGQMTGDILIKEGVNV